jgi:peroxiredoxin
MTKKTFIIIASTSIILSLIWILLSPVLYPEVEADPGTTAVHKGFQAPDFGLKTPSGETLSLSDYKGQPVLVFFWASWCSVCKRTMPDLEKVYPDFASRGFEILAVNTTYQDILSNAEAYFQSQEYSFPMLLDQDGRVSEVYHLHAVPLSVLIAPDGKVLDVIIGSGMSEGYLRASLENLFDEMN